ncbi:MAG: hypothetical protein RL088_1618 [Verrucomicrobiota bacterium]|jgi:hypothetical protein
MHNSFSQRVILVLFFAFCTAGLMQFYRHMVWKANHEINGDAAVESLYSDKKRK